MPSVPALPFIRSAISQGQSANAAYRAMRSAVAQLTDETGEQFTGMRRSTFLETYSATVALRARVPEALTQPKDEIPFGGDIPDRPTVRHTGYGNWAIAFSRERGSNEVLSEFYYQRTEAPLTPQQIEDMAEQDFLASSQTQHGSKAGFVFLGATFVGAEKLVPGG